MTIATMHATPYPHVNAVLDELLVRMQGVIGEKLVGVYLFGSLVSGGYADGISDIDLLAATTADIDDIDLEALRLMHDRFVRDYPQWDDRIEVAYLSATALQTFKSGTSRLAIISPGEPLHTVDAGRDWLINWYLVLDRGVTLVGSPPGDVIAAISNDEYVAAVREHAGECGESWGFLDDRGTQAYAILTMCRALYTHRTGEHVSKEHAASWAQHQLPEWADLIREAPVWRTTPRAQDGDDRTTLPESLRFVAAIKHRIVSES